LLHLSSETLDNAQQCNLILANDFYTLIFKVLTTQGNDSLAAMIKSQCVWKDMSLLHFWLEVFEDILYTTVLSACQTLKRVFLYCCVWRVPQLWFTQSALEQSSPLSAGRQLVGSTNELLNGHRGHAASSTFHTKRQTLCIYGCPIYSWLSMHCEPGIYSTWYGWG